MRCPDPEGRRGLDILTGILVMNRDRRLTGFLRGQSSSPVAPDGYELNNPWRVCHLRACYRTKRLTIMCRSSDAYARRRPTPTHEPRGGQFLKSSRLWLFASFGTGRLGGLNAERRICLIATLQMIFACEEQSDRELYSLVGQTMQDGKRGFATQVSAMFKIQYYEHFMNSVRVKRCMGESCWVSYAITESVLCSCSGHPTACKPDISPGLTCSRISHIFPIPVLPLRAYL